MTDMEWISVKYRLPEKGQEVIVYSGKDVESGIYYYNGFSYFDYGSPSNVTHWMPLPEPPKQ